jgi:hypothetical protein
MVRKVRRTLCPLLGVLLVPLVAGCLTPELIDILLQPPPPPLSAAASAPAGTVDEATQLTGSASGGVTPYTYQWAQTGGPTVSITNATSATASFTASAAGMYTFQFTVTDSAAQTAVATVQVAVGDIMFVVPHSSGVIMPGNPAVLEVSSRAGPTNVNARVRVFDPEFTDDQQTQMQVHYELVTVPTAARTDDVSLDRNFDTISNQGTGDFDSDISDSGAQTLDGQVQINFRANPDVSFNALTNIASLVEAFGRLVPGQYVFRATVTNPNGLRRDRDLTITLVVQSTDTHSGFGGEYGATSAGPTTVAVKQLPAGSPGYVTDKVMTATDSATMTVSVFPSTTTSYRFYLLDNNSVAHPEFVGASPSALEVAAGDTETDIDLTIGPFDTGTVGTFSLYMESFDGLSNVNNVQVLVNDPVGAALGTAVRFHVTDDFYAASSINAANVGSASGNVDAPVPYEGWSDTTPLHGNWSALADVNLDGALDIITTAATGFEVNTQGFEDGSTAALRHPENNENFDDNLADPDITVSTGVAYSQLAAGDLNADGYPDVAVSYTSGGVGYVDVFFHTGNPANPYSDITDQALRIAPPYYTRQYRDVDGDVTATPAGGTAPATPGRDEFGTRIAIYDFTGVSGGQPDGVEDLIVTDPAFSSLQIYQTTGARPAAMVDFFGGQEGRVYVFAGGTTGQLQPGRPDIVTAEILEVGVTNAVPEPASVEVTVTNTKYVAVFTGDLFDQIGHSLAVGGSIAVGSPEALADGVPYATIEIPALGNTRVPDAATVATTVGGVARTYEFDTDDPANITAGNVRVNISATDADLPANALDALRDAINNDTDAVVTAADDPANADQLILTSVFSAQDQKARTDAWLATAGFGGTTVNTDVPAYSEDGIVYRIANGAASGTLADPINGTLNSDMGLGAALAYGDVNGSAGGVDDLVVSALDSGDALGENDGFNSDGVSDDDDGAVFVVLDGATTLPAAVGDVGANTLGNPGDPPITNTSVGCHVAARDVNGDGLAEVLFTEPGFDRIHVIKGAATPSTSPNITFWGIIFDDSLMNDDPATLPAGGVFLFGDITGDTQDDWLFLDSRNAFGFAGFDRSGG